MFFIWLIILRMPPLPDIFFIMRCISVNCLSSLLTSCTCMPEPAAIRRLREPLMRSGWARSLGVMELMMASIRTVSLSSIWSLTLSGRPDMPGSLSSIPIMPPMLRIWASCSRKSSRSKPLPLLTLLASLAAFSLSTLRSTSSMRDSTSPMPRMREARRSGWNGSSASVFSPIPMNLTGLPVMWRTDRAAPPRASPSALVRITPVSGSASLNALAVLAASWPVMASTTNRVSTGLMVAWRCLISSIISPSTCRRPAVSTITTS